MKLMYPCLYHDREKRRLTDLHPVQRRLLHNTRQLRLFGNADNQPPLAALTLMVAT